MTSRIVELGALALLGLSSGCASLEQQAPDPMNPDGPVVGEIGRRPTPVEAAKTLDDLLRALGKFGKTIEVTNPFFFKCSCVGDVTTAKHTVQGDCGPPDLPPCDSDKPKAAEVRKALEVLAAAIDAELKGEEVKIGP